jgi:hypothetical protein
MFKQYFFAGLAAGIFGTIISVSYILIFKYSPLEADFSEKATLLSLFSKNMLIAMIACFLSFGLKFLIKKEVLATFIADFLLSGLAIAMCLFTQFTVDMSLNFKNENAEAFKDYYYFIVSPISFFTILSWFTFKPLFLKNKQH